MEIITFLLVVKDLEIKLTRVLYKKIIKVPLIIIQVIGLLEIAILDIDLLTNKMKNKWMIFSMNWKKKISNNRKMVNKKDLKRERKQL